MTQHTPDDLWRDFPKTAREFERRFATEEDCRGVLDRGALGRQAGMRTNGIGMGEKDLLKIAHEVRSKKKRPTGTPKKE
jgi:hypothetical protein